MRIKNPNTTLHGIINPARQEKRTGGFPTFENPFQPILMTANYEKTEHFDQPYSELFDKCRSAVDYCGFKIRGMNNKSGVIKAEAFHAIPAMGSELLSISVSKDRKVFVKSTCGSPMQVIGWGRNKKMWIFI